MSRPALDQRGINTDMVVECEPAPAGNLNDLLEQAAPNGGLREPASILEEGRGDQHGIVNIQADEPTELQVAVQLLQRHVAQQVTAFLVITANFLASNLRSRYFPSFEECFSRLLGLNDVVKEVFQFRNEITVATQVGQRDVAA